MNNLLEAKNLTQKFIKEFDLSGSNWVGGRIIDKENNFIYTNFFTMGGIWESENYPCKEIEI